MARSTDKALSKHNYSLIRKVGEGSFGAALLVQHQSDRDRDTKAIVKVIDISRASRQEKEDSVKESQVLSSLKHPYIVRYRESFHEDGWLCIVMDYCEGGDLADKLKKLRHSGKSLSQDQVLRWFTQAILALKYIHDMHILHRDLKSGNFFLSRSGNIKIGDFGIAKVLECTAACAQTQIGTPYYLSPEICMGRPYSWSSDIWSMGCILYEMCARRVPFDAQDLKSLIQKITKGSAPELPPEYSSSLRSLCKEIFEKDPAKRPPAAEILKRPVVQDMVRKMLEEVKGEEDSGAAGGDRERERDRGDRDRERDRAGEASEAASSHAAGTPAAGAPASARHGGAGCYQKNEHVEYYSETHGEWLPAAVTNVNEDGRIMLNVKPNVWLPLKVQTAKVRPRQSGGGGSRPPQPASAGGGGAAPPHSPGAAGRRPPAGERRSEGSAVNGSGAQASERPSRDPGSGNPQRGASPLHQPAGRTPSHDNRGSRRTPQRQSASPFRGGVNGPSG
eukprot:TRINITY_DN6277_c0_g1_i1.p1 TRINITY_DN6277_c0_g1~~TRINITY_DN6277_c0_g1_i1.p1  ORF type:complete len:505 (+),score=75.58 TRINITY_DN6277_c0_g1_i1:128-1642(+)